MVFSIVIILMLGLVAYFHYVQGFFSATISAMITVIAAALALGYDETIVNLLLKGAMADQAHAIVLCGIFAVVYVVLRVIFDMAIPGNVRVPSGMEKAGSALMGIVAGIFVTGIFAIAAQMLPFDPAIGFLGYSRFSVKDRTVVLPMGENTASLDSHMSEEMEDNTLDPAKEKGLLIPVDDWVMDVVYHLSDNGSLSGFQPLSTIHPDYLTELFGERLGTQPGGRRSALHFPGKESVEIGGLFSVPTLPAMDGQLLSVRPPGYIPAFKDTVKPGPDQRILIARIKVGGNVTDDPDLIFRFSTGAIRLVGNSKDFYPIGTLENSNTVLLNKPDDFLFAKAGDAFDAVFLIDQNLIEGSKTQATMATGVFVSVKRFANLDLSGMSVGDRITANTSGGVIRYKALAQKLKSLPPPPAAEAAQPARTSRAAVATPSVTPDAPAPPVTPAAPVAAEPAPGKDISDSLSATASSSIMAPGSISLGTTSSDADAQNAPVAGGTINLKAGLIAAATVDPSASLSQLSQGPSSYNQFFVPLERTMIQVVVHPYASGWDWTNQLGSTSLVDANGNKYPPSGVYTLAKTADSRGLLMRYDANHGMSINTPDAPQVGDIYYIFLIPHDTDLKGMTLGAKQQNLDSALHVQ